MPKCNLHSHLEGSIRPATWLELAAGQGVEVPRTEAVESLLQVDGSEGTLVDYLAKISRTYPVLKDREALQRAAFEAAEDAASDGVVYFELRAGPLTHARPGLPAEDVIESILQGLQEAESRCGIVARLIVSALRDHPPKSNVGLAEMAVGFSGRGVVGFDLAGDEARFPAAAHAAAFDVARRGGLGITVHAGEAAGPENVEYAVQELEATRIGHGVSSARSAKTVHLLKSRGVLLEVCPTSNVHTGAVDTIANHPVRRLFDQGIAVSVGDDDPVTSRTRLSNELTLLQHQFDFTWDELVEIQRIGLEKAFIREADEKAGLAEVIARGARPGSGV